MKKSFTVILILLGLSVKSQEVEVLTFAQLQQKMIYTDAPLTLFNFWATWCGPCIKEMPHFEEINEKNEDVKVVFVSVDFKQDLEKVKKFVKTRGLKSDVIFLDEKDPDEFMRKVDPNWSGAIPATLFVNDLGKTFFQENAFSKEQLLEAVERYLK